MSQITKGLIQVCKEKLLTMKSDVLNRVRKSRAEFDFAEKNTGDEADQTVALLNENQFLSTQERLRFQLNEIEFALGRIENGTFGICEETAEAIESNRLLAIPYTRLSIEGAEIREAMKHKYANL